MNHTLNRCRIALAVAAVGAAGFTADAAAQAKEQFVPINAYWVGPYAAGGSGITAGMIDYFKLLNTRDGGLNGVKVSWEKCETEYNNARGVECYERSKKKGPTGATMIHPMSTGITYSLIDKGTVDKVPIVSVGYGRTDASDGRVFPYVFPLITNYWSQNTAKIKFIGMREGGMDKLKGKKIVNLYHDSAYGKETIPVLDAQAKKYGFEVTHIAVPHPGNEQQAQWLQVRQVRPDWVILRGWGVMNPTALKAAAKVGFPRDKVLGVWWSGAEEDVIPAGEAGKGYIAAGFNAPGHRLPGAEGDPEARVRQGPGRARRQDALRHDLLQPRRALGDPDDRGGADRAREVRQGSADDRRAGALGPREPEDRRDAPQGARRGRLHAAAQGVVHGPRRGRRSEVPAVGRQAVESDHRLDRLRPVARAADDRGVGGAVREGEGHHAARLREGRIGRKNLDVLRCR